MYGVQARGSVRLSEVARSLVEETCLKKRIDRLSRNLGRKGLAEEIGSAVPAQGGARVGQDMLLIVDPTDLRKKYAGQMEYLATVRDGSEKECGLGYFVPTLSAPYPLKKACDWNIRHCERSEAISLGGKAKTRRLRRRFAPRNDIPSNPSTWVARENAPGKLREGRANEGLGRLLSCFVA